MMAKCKICKSRDAEWSWQPFGPGETSNLFATPGSHYRGFPVVKVCDDCKRNYQSGIPTIVNFRGEKIKFTLGRQAILVG